jgi:dihydrofolate synthase/folylpolyglutamate synthase
MPGLQKIQRALSQTEWLKLIDPSRVIVVAGTNGKGTTCAVLESLLLEANQGVGFYSSPHLICTTERIRLNGKNITEENFVELFKDCEQLIRTCELTHFESLTLMAASYYFSPKWKSNVDFAIFEVGLGGTFDATNAIPHRFCVITKLGLDHQNILGHSIEEIAKNKFGIISKKNIVVHHRLPVEVQDLKLSIQKDLGANFFESDMPNFEVKDQNSLPSYYLKYMGEKFATNLVGARAIENAMTAIATFQILGFDFAANGNALKKVNWAGRMQKVQIQKCEATVYLSGDHNEQGIKSLFELLGDFTYRNLYLVLGVGQDKDVVAMLPFIESAVNCHLYLTQTPFKGRKVEDYPESIRRLAVVSDNNSINLLEAVCQKAQQDDLVVVSGSLYLVGEVLAAVERGEI